MSKIIKNKNFKKIINCHERSVVYAFDDRTIRDIFSERGVAVILFHSAKAGETLAAAYNEAATTVRVSNGKSIIFTEIPVINFSFRLMENTMLDYPNTSKLM
jgi:hypothetical protein